jgi:hypothetical protein
VFEESTNTEDRVTARTEPQANQEVETSSVRDRKPGLTPGRTKGPTGVRSTCLFRVSRQSEREGFPTL